MARLEPAHPVERRRMTTRATNHPKDGPTEERKRHGPIERAEGPVKSGRGEYVAPFVVIDVLDRMEMSGLIDADEKRAGERFRKWFRIAQLDQLRAGDMGRPIVDGGSKIPEVSFRAEYARNQIAKAIRWVGGSQSSQASCLWHVLGLEQSMRSWSREHPRKITHLNASGVLAAALERLARMPWRGPDE